MNTESIRSYCLSKKCVTESFPFNDTALVFKVMDKMFALLNLEGDLTISLKCAPEKAIELREKYPAVTPGYHMSKKHWNTIAIDGSVREDIIHEWVDHSYNLVVSKLTKKQKEELNNM